MAYIPEFYQLSKLKAATINAIGTDIGAPVVVSDLNTLHQYGSYITGTTAAQNAFCNALINQIAKVVYTSKSYQNSLKLFKKGILGYGELVEDIFVEIANGYARNEDLTGISESSTTAITPADVKTAFYMSNARTVYSVSIRRADLDKAFQTFEGVDELINRIVDSLNRGHEYDEYILTKYKLGQLALAGYDNALTVTNSGDNEKDAKAVLTAARATVGELKFMRSDRNIAEVLTATAPEDIGCVLSTDTEANIDVNALAAAFNLGYADFIGKRVEVNGFAMTDAEVKRYQNIVGDESAVPFTDEEKAKLAKVKMIVCDVDAVKIYDTHEPYFTEDYNGRDDVRTYHLHTDSAYAVCPFANFRVITEA